MANTKITNNNPEKEPTSDKSITGGKTREISRKNTSQNKNVFPTNKKKDISVDEISNEIFKDLIINIINGEFSLFVC